MPQRAPILHGEDSDEALTEIERTFVNAALDLAVYVRFFGVRSPQE